MSLFSRKYLSLRAIPVLLGEGVLVAMLAWFLSWAVPDAWLGPKTRPVIFVLGRQPDLVSRVGFVVLYPVVSVFLLAFVLHWWHGVWFCKRNGRA